MIAESEESLSDNFIADSQVDSAPKKTQIRMFKGVISQTKKWHVKEF